jgi:hypothetical protein
MIEIEKYQKIRELRIVLEEQIRATKLILRQKHTPECSALQSGLESRLKPKITACLVLIAEQRGRVHKVPSLNKTKEALCKYYLEELMA